jgi:hypothetical protein
MEESPMNIRSESPILRRTATVRRVDALFQAMSNDFLLRQQFITNPTHVLSEYVYGTAVQISPQQASASNQLIYAVLSDRNLLTWLHGYAAEHRGDVPSGAQFAKDFAQAIADHAGRHVTIALIRSSVEGYGLVTFDEDLLHFFFNLGALVDREGDDELDDEAPSEAESKQKVFATGTCTAITWKTWLITRPQAEVDERFSVGQPTEFAPRYVMVTLDELSTYAAGLRNSGALELHVTPAEAP